MLTESGEGDTSGRSMCIDYHDLI